MDGGLNKIASVLIAVFVLTFLLLAAQILYVLSRRRHQHGGGEPNEKCFYLFCLRNQSRIEPKEIASISKTHDDFEGAVVVVETAVADDELEKWQELCGPSRTLFTIQEEEESEGIESFDYDPIPKLKPPSSNPDDADEDTMTFHTPCGSPAYFTPSPSQSPSPTREASNFPVDGGCWDHNRTTPFLAIEISSH